mmetsp:Transcript_14700/g.14321  ORF Transcript_14700/g.14321 Transcript_14700/m.14321 type:complete len:127 (+) Transcript_14700:119-499(+)
MEDAHITTLDVIKDEVSLFGVFDGHGGAEVARYVEKNFVPTLIKNENFKKGAYGEALQEVFVALDMKLLTEAGKKELIQIAKKNGQQIDSGVDLSEQAGCTACVALVTKTAVYVANAGDTRCVIAS